ncbi:hypothetical protein EB796_018860 [Bugula neritina]|uniref:Uncharacterized protein n=1 Tax=Bugula neritina TaxID=10212 RepID=A0A7J7JAY5_BUGNE|nr:hypothetical protein EB796_018860 [Bugula neritina]
MDMLADVSFEVPSNSCTNRVLRISHASEFTWSKKTLTIMLHINSIYCSLPSNRSCFLLCLAGPSLVLLNN